MCPACHPGGLGMAARGDSRAQGPVLGVEGAPVPIPEDGLLGWEGLDAVVLLGRPGVVRESWTREGVPRDMVSVMAATLADIVDRLNEALGGAPPHHVTFILDDRRIVVERMPGSEVLILAAGTDTPAMALRRAARAVRIRLATARITSVTNPRRQPARAVD